MRSIKFRGKQAFGNKAGRWLYGSLSLRSYEAIIEDGFSAQIYDPSVLSDLSAGWIYVDPKTVGQFTGLVDKNGVDIYENDEIKCHGMKFIIKYDEASFWASSENGGAMLCKDWLEIGESEVIGHTHTANHKEE